MFGSHPHPQAPHVPSTGPTVQVLSMLDYYLLPTLLQFVVLNILLAIVFDRFIDIKAHDAHAGDPWKLEREVAEQLFHIRCGPLQQFCWCSAIQWPEYL